ncbi:unnamed protein product [Rotaria sordida]|uniref:Ion transport domain-containing protein n=1 Tax=Rotaria sordida TaxID=392033 RepID=A0A819PDG2_9BILA|nr:unnamed protein product [Rotaria sordida]CAF4012185.1 unnamed protein product [Rotaria sordida]
MLDDIIFAVTNADTDSNQSEVEQQTELMYTDNTIWTAVFNADKTAIDHLIDIDPDVINTRGAVGECPIHMLFLCGTDAHLEIARDLIIRFPIIVTQIYNKPRYYGENILHIAIVKRNPTMVEWLLYNNHLESYREELLTATATGDFFKIGQPSYYGETPLGFACCTNQWDIVEILLKYGADMDATDSNDNTILHMLVICNLTGIYAKFKARWVEQQIINDSKIIIKSKLMKHTKLWNRLNKDGLTPLTLAADLGRAQMLSWLLDERKTIQWSYGNVSCVLHPLDQLDRDFDDDNKQRILSVIEVMIKNNNPELVHPIITSLIDKKWKYFASRILIRRFLITFLYLLVFLGTTIIQQTRPEIIIADENDQKAILINGKYSSVMHKILSRIGRFIVILGALLKSAREIHEMRSLGFWNYINSTGSIFLENFLSCSFCLGIFITQIFHLFEIHHYETLILAFTSLIGWGYMFFFIMPFRFTGPFVIMIYKMLFNDVLRFCIIYIIFLAGFSQSFFILFNENGLPGYISSIKQCFLGLLGDFDLDYYTGGQYPLTSVTLLIIYIIVITILLLNLLIAMMGDTYADVKQNAKKLWHLERARIALDVERGISKSKRHLQINKYWIDVKGERYLQVEQVNNELFSSIDDKTKDDE